MTSAWWRFRSGELHTCKWALYSASLIFSPLKFASISLHSVQISAWTFLPRIVNFENFFTTSPILTGISGFKFAILLKISVFPLFQRSSKCTTIILLNNILKRNICKILSWSRLFSDRTSIAPKEHTKVPIHRIEVQHSYHFQPSSHHGLHLS